MWENETMQMNGMSNLESRTQTNLIGNLEFLMQYGDSDTSAIIVGLIKFLCFSSNNYMNRENHIKIGIETCFDMY